MRAVVLQEGGGLAVEEVTRPGLERSTDVLVPVDARQGDPVGQIRAATGGHGVDVALEAIGHPDSFAGAVRSVRRGGTVSVVGLFPGPVEFPLNDLVFYGLNVSMGLGNLSRMPQLMSLVEEGRIDPAPLATHRFTLEDAVEAYELFETRKDECLKVLLQPGTAA